MKNIRCPPSALFFVLSAFWSSPGPSCVILPRRGPSVDGFDPSRVEKLGWRPIRGRRAQNPAPLPTATHLQPLRGSDAPTANCHLRPRNALALAGGPYMVLRCLRPLGNWAECTNPPGMALRRAMIPYMTKGGMYAPRTEARHVCYRRLITMTFST